MSFKISYGALEGPLCVPICNCCCVVVPSPAHTEMKHISHLSPTLPCQRRRWVPSGNAFFIYDQKSFVETIMSVHFQNAKFDSFTRRMRRWGFHRVESPDQRDKGIYIFACKLFRRDKPELCKIMCDDRQLKKKNSQSASLVLPNVHRRFDEGMGVVGGAGGIVGAPFVAQKEGSQLNTMDPNTMAQQDMQPFMNPFQRQMFPYGAPTNMNMGMGMMNPMMAMGQGMMQQGMHPQMMGMTTGMAPMPGQPAMNKEEFAMRCQQPAMYPPQMTNNMGGFTPTPGGSIPLAGPAPLGQNFNPTATSLPPTSINAPMNGAPTIPNDNMQMPLPMMASASKGLSHVQGQQQQTPTIRPINQQQTPSSPNEEEKQRSLADLQANIDECEKELSLVTRLRKLKEQRASMAAACEPAGDDGTQATLEIGSTSSISPGDEKVHEV